MCWKGTVCDNEKQESLGHLLQALERPREVWTCGNPGLSRTYGVGSRPGLASLPSRGASLLWPLSWAAGGRSPGLCSLNLSWEPFGFIPLKSSMALGRSFNLYLNLIYLHL